MDGIWRDDLKILSLCSTCQDESRGIMRDGYFRSGIERLPRELMAGMVHRPIFATSTT